MSDIKDYIISKEVWHDAVSRSRRIQDEYGISVDPALILMVPDPLLIVLGQNAQLLKLSGATEFIGRPIKFKVIKDDRIIVKYRNGVEAIVRVNGNTGDERIKEALRISRAYHYVVSNGAGWTVKKIYDVDKDVEAAKKIVNQYGTRRAVAMALGLSEDGLRAYWPRATVLITRGHYLELSEPGTGKTTFSYFVARVLGGAVVNEDPSEAYLVGDMRDNSYGIVFTSNIIIFDEIDKWKIQTIKTYNILLSGLENCQWSRTKGKGMEITKCVTFAAFGNSIPRELSRDSVTELLSEKLKIHAKPLVDRIPVINLDAPRFNVGYLGDMLKPAVTRGLAYIMTQNAEETYKELQSKYDSRTAWAMAVIKTLLTYVKEDVPADDEIETVYKYGAEAIEV